MDWQKENKQQLNELSDSYLKFEKIVADYIRTHIPHKPIRVLIGYDSFSSERENLFGKVAYSTDFGDYLDQISEPSYRVITRMKQLGILKNNLEFTDEEKIRGYDEGWVFTIDVDRFRTHYEQLQNEILNRSPFDLKSLSITRIGNDAIHFVFVSGDDLTLKIPNAADSGKLLKILFDYWFKDATKEDSNAIVFVDNKKIEKELERKGLDMERKNLKDIIGYARTIIKNQKLTNIISIKYKENGYSLVIDISKIALTP